MFHKTNKTLSVGSVLPSEPFKIFPGRKKTISSWFVCWLILFGATIWRTIVIFGPQQASRIMAPSPRRLNWDQRLHTWLLWYLLILMHWYNSVYDLTASPLNTSIPPSFLPDMTGVCCSKLPAISHDRMRECKQCWFAIFVLTCMTYIKYELCGFVCEKFIDFFLQLDHWQHEILYISSLVISNWMV